MGYVGDGLGGSDDVCVSWEVLFGGFVHGQFCVRGSCEEEGVVRRRKNRLSRHIWQNLQCEQINIKVFA